MGKSMLDCRRPGREADFLEQLKCTEMRFEFQGAWTPKWLTEPAVLQGRSQRAEALEAFTQLLACRGKLLPGEGPPTTFPKEQRAPLFPPRCSLAIS